MTTGALTVTARQAEPGTLDEVALWNRLSRGDRGAADDLAASTYRMVFASLFKLCGDEDLAADLTQETYRKAWRALAGFRGGCAITSWLCRIAYTTYLNHIRRPRRLVPLEEEDGRAVPDTAASPGSVGVPSTRTFMTPNVAPRRPHGTGGCGRGSCRGAPGWALPGGFVDYGESLESAAVREAKEETSLDIELVRQFHAYSDPARDTRQHNVTLVFIARAVGGKLKGRDDARRAGVFARESLPSPLAFDHGQILEDYFEGRY